MSSIIEQLDEDFHDTYSVARKAVNIHLHNTTDVSSIVRDTKIQLEELRDVIAQMEVEIGGLPASQRNNYQQRIASYKSDVIQLDRDLSKGVAEVERQELMSGVDYDIDVSSSDDARAKLLNNTNRLDSASDRLDRSYKIALETQDIGMGIMDNLHSQRETLEHTREGLRSTDSGLKKSQRILRGMMRRAIQNKFLMAFVVLFLLGSIALIIWLKVRTHKTSSTSPSFPASSSLPSS